MNYITDRSLVQDRQGDDVEDLKNIVRNKWSVTQDQSYTCGNIQVYFNDNKAQLGDFSGNGTWSFMQISSALALYRTIALFHCGLCSEMVDFYKMNWCIHLEHKETKCILGLGEWKGAFQIFTPFHDINQVNAHPSYKRDVEELLTLLASPTMTIDYDGTVAGTVA